VLKPKQHATTTEETYVTSAMRIAELAAGKKARDIRAFNVNGMTLITDVFVLCTATSEPQMKAVANAIREGMREVGVSPLNTEGNHRATWLLIDYGEVIVHLFREEARAFYDLEGLWGDAPEITLDLD
jgi:ribosome-associated protein